MNNSNYKTNEGKKIILDFYDEILSKSAIKIELLDLNTSFGNTFIIASGDPYKPPLVMLHGSNINSLMWLNNIERYSKDFRVYAIDILGEPGKSEENRLSFKNDDYTNWLLEILEELKIKTVKIIGVSLGGLLSSKFASEYNNKVDKLVLVSPAGIQKQKNSFFIKVLPLLFLGKFGHNKINKLVYYKTKINKTMNKLSELLFLHYNPRVEKVPILTEKQLSLLSMDVFYIGGEKDIILDARKTNIKLSNHVEKLQVKILQDTGHIIVDVQDDIITFLNT